MTGETPQHEPYVPKSPEQGETPARISAAEQLLKALHEGKDPTADITELLRETSEHGEAEDRIVADEVGELAIVDQISEGSEVPLLLAEQPINELEVALRDLVEVRGKHAGETVIDAIERIEREHDLNGDVELIADTRDADGPEGATVETEQNVQHITGEDILASLEYLPNEIFQHNHVTSLLQMEIEGEAVLDDEAIKAIADYSNLDRLRVLNRYDEREGSWHVPSEAMHLAKRIAAREYDDKEMYLHLGAMRILATETGVAPREWQRHLAAGEELPEAARRYAEHEQLPRLDFLINYAESLYPDVMDSLDKSKPLEERQRLQEQFRREATETINVIYGVEKGEEVPDDIQRMIIGFKQGDLRQFGYDKGETNVFNAQGIEAVKRYIDRVGSIGAENAKKLNETFGTINFMAYSRETLQAMLRYTSRPEEYPSVDIIIRGANGDHNGAFDELLRDRKLAQTLVFEVDTPQQIDTINTLLDKNNTDIRKVTLAGHGDRRGLHLSRNSLVGGQLPDGRRTIYTSLLDLMKRVTPDEKGERAVVLDSCSQGRRYGGKNSLAEAISLLVPDARVEAAPRVAFLHEVAGGAEGDVQVRTNRHYELAEFLQKHDKYPGVGFLVRKLMSEKRKRSGTYVVRGGRRSRDKSGIVNIGA